MTRGTTGAVVEVAEDETAGMVVTELKTNDLVAEEAPDMLPPGVVPGSMLEVTAAYPRSSTIATAKIVPAYASRETPRLLTISPL